MTHIFPDHHHDVTCGDCSEPLRITCTGLAARYTEAVCPIRTGRHACAECVTKPRCEECGEVIDRRDRCCCDAEGYGRWGEVADWERDDDARDRAIESGIAREEGGEG